MVSVCNPLMELLTRHALYPCVDSWQLTKVSVRHFFVEHRFDELLHVGIHLRPEPNVVSVKLAEVEIFAVFRPLDLNFWKRFVHNSHSWLKPKLLGILMDVKVKDVFFIKAFNQRSDHFLPIRTIIMSDQNGRPVTVPIQIPHIPPKLPVPAASHIFHRGSPRKTLIKQLGLHRLAQTPL